MAKNMQRITHMLSFPLHTTCKARMPHLLFYLKKYRIFISDEREILNPWIFLLFLGKLKLLFFKMSKLFHSKSMKQNLRNMNSFFVTTLIQSLRCFENCTVPGVWFLFFVKTMECCLKTLRIRPQNTRFLIQMSYWKIDYFSGVGNSIRNCFYMPFASYTCSPWGKMSENNEATLYISNLQEGK